MEDEELDYMSEQFVANIDCTKGDVKPGLIYNRSLQRKNKQQQKKQELDVKNRMQFVSFNILEAKHRSCGLEQPLGPENRGFAMLQKMGFTPGSCLGSNNEGITEPIAVTIKNNRTGLGREQVLREIQARKQRYRQKRQETRMDPDKYRLALSKKYKEREVIADLRKSEKVCYRLDTENELEKPDEYWFWPDHCRPNLEDEDCAESDDDSVQYDAAEKLDMLTLYLRQTYYYCSWCGVKFEDNDDLIASCPGPTKDDH